MAPIYIYIGWCLAINYLAIDIFLQKYLLILWSYLVYCVHFCGMIWPWLYHRTVADIRTRRFTRRGGPTIFALWQPNTVANTRTRTWTKYTTWGGRWGRLWVCCEKYKRSYTYTVIHRSGGGGGSIWPLWEHNREADTRTLLFTGQEGGVASGHGGSFT